MDQETKLNSSASTAANRQQKESDISPRLTERVVENEVEKEQCDTPEAEKPRVGSFPEHDGGIYVGEHTNGKQNGKGSVLYRDGTFYSGRFLGNLFFQGVHFEHNEFAVYREGQITTTFGPAEADNRLFVTIGLVMVKQLRRLVLQQCRRHNNRKKKLPLSLSVRKRMMNSYEKSLTNDHSTWHLHGDNNFSLYSIDGQAAVTLPSTQAHPSSHKVEPEGLFDLREEIAHTASPEAVFACASPCTTEYFDTVRFVQRFAIFFFPLFSLPGVCCNSCVEDGKEMERDFIVSGASLQRSFNYPNLSLYVVLFSFFCEAAAALILVSTDAKLGSLCDGGISIGELILPVVMGVLFALMCASYYSFLRSPHGLERMNRQLTSELTALAANVVDARSEICVYTWDETGRDKEKNKRYRLKWAIISTFSSLIIGGSSTLIRLGFNTPLARKASERVIVLLTTLSLTGYSFLITYYIMKNLDLLREVKCKLKVLTEIAYIEKRSLFTGKYYRVYFSCDERLNIFDLKSGFTGWYTTRSLVLCASTVANHEARSSVISITLLLVIFMSTVAVGIAALRTGPVKDCIYTHWLVVISGVLFTWGPLHMNYLVVSSGVKAELQNHLYIMDVVGLYHRVKLHDIDASDIIKDCRNMAFMHDVVPSLFHTPLHSLLSFFLVVWIAVGILLTLYLLLTVFLIR